MIVDQDMKTNMGNMVVGEEEMMVTMKKEILVEVTMVAVGTIKILEIIVDNNNQIMGPQSGTVLGSSSGRPYSHGYGSDC